MRLSPKDLARALYLATRQEPEKKAGGFVKNLTEVAKRRGLERSLPDILAALPAAMEEVDKESRVTIESATAISDATAEKMLAAAGIPTENVEVVRKVVPELVSGFRIRTRDGVIDATARRTLDDLARTMRRPAAED
ncbi:MAG TPA: F0F1 ATP synthase subunit delta [Candidatus Eisenbacteria bacterium]|jgi:F0F1-type ATP synthase delta subunit|nr:F0F1 ATP synthase subunit delta [Candidatus Eisenbacteria bacterium]